MDQSTLIGVKADADVCGEDGRGEALLHGRAGGLGAMWIRHFAGAGDGYRVMNGVVLTGSICP
jgi:hypothetical protein